MVSPSLHIFIYKQDKDDTFQSCYEASGTLEAIALAGCRRLCAPLFPSTSGGEWAMTSDYLCSDPDPASQQSHKLNLITMVQFLVSVTWKATISWGCWKDQMKSGKCFAHIKPNKYSFLPLLVAFQNTLLKVPQIEVQSCGLSSSLIP